MAYSLELSDLHIYNIHGANGSRGLQNTSCTTSECIPPTLWGLQVKSCSSEISVFTALVSSLVPKSRSEVCVTHCSEASALGLLCVPGALVSHFDLLVRINPSNVPSLSLLLTTQQCTMGEKRDHLYSRH